MGARASASVRIAAPASGAIYAQMLAGASRAISIREIIVVTRTAVPTDLAIARSFSVGTASADNVATGVAHRKPRQTDLDGTVEIGWGTSPSGPTGAHSYLRRELVGGGFSGAATGMRHIMWSEMDGPLAVEPTGATGAGLLLVNVGSAAGAALDVIVTWEYGPIADR